MISAPGKKLLPFSIRILAILLSLSGLNEKFLLLVSESAFDLFGARAFIPLFHTFSTVIPLLSTGLSTKLSTTSDVSFKIRPAYAGYNVCLSVEIPRIWVSFGITDFIWLCTSPHELSTVIHRNLHKFSTLLTYKTRWAYKKTAVRLIRNLPRSRFSKNNSLSTLGLRPNAPPKSFPNARGSVCRIPY